MRVEYIGKSVNSLGVLVPNEPPIQCGFNYGVRFSALETPFGRNTETIDINKKDDADVLVLEPDAFEKSHVVIVVVVNHRCLQNPGLFRWLKETLERDPNGFTYAQIFVPERRTYDNKSARTLGRDLEREGIEADAFSYYSKLIK